MRMNSAMAHRRGWHEKYVCKTIYSVKKKSGGRYEHSLEGHM